MMKYYDLLNLREEQEKALKNKYKKYFKLIKDKQDYNEILSTFLIYCNDNDINWNFPYLMGMREENLSIDDGLIFTKELNKFICAVNSEYRELNEISYINKGGLYND